MNDICLEFLSKISPTLGVAIMPPECKDQISSAGRSITIKNMNIELENNPVDFHMCLWSNFTKSKEEEHGSLYYYNMEKGT